MVVVLEVVHAEEDLTVADRLGLEYFLGPSVSFVLASCLVLNPAACPDQC